MRTAVRPPAVAGAFYPADPRRLAADVRSFLAAASTPELGFTVRGLIVPHAGYVYSGPVAATGYRLVEGRDDLRRVVMLGPSHFVWFEGLALPDADRLSTPLGELTVDRAAVALLEESPLVVESAVAHAREHSLEVQLPFLQVVLPDAAVVPILTGDVDPADVARVVAPLVDDGTLLVVSSDLSHYHDYDTARRLDAVTAEAIVGREPDALGRDSACGRTGIQASLHLARRFGWRVERCDLRNSGDTAGPRDRVVGYGTFALG